jgi:hypothetical protein
MTMLLLAGTAILAASDTVSDLGDRWATEDGHFMKHVVTDVVDGATLPAGFRLGRYTYEAGAFVEIPAPEPTQAEIDAVTEARRRAYAAKSDHLFIAWQASVATNGADQAARKAAWLAARAAVQARLPYPEA